MRVLVAAAAALIALPLGGCGGGDGHQSAGERAMAVEPNAPRSIAVTSPAFEEGGTIPAEYTCHGKGLSPPIQWSGVSGDEVRALALVVDDPDAPGGGYVHWVVLGIPTGHGAIDADTVPDGAHEIPASGGPGWSPPCPPSGTHHYRFTLYAFPANELSAVSGGVTLEERLAFLAEDAVAWGRLTGTVTASGGDSGGGY